jgi:hypothetical protein
LFYERSSIAKGLERSFNIGQWNNKSSHRVLIQASET